MAILSEAEFHDLSRATRRALNQSNNDALMAFVEPATLASDIRENLLIVEELVRGCNNLQKSDDGWWMGFSGSQNGYRVKVGADQLILAERLMRFTRQTVVYHCGEIVITFEWRPA